MSEAYLKGLRFQRSVTGFPEGTWCGQGKEGSAGAGGGLRWNKEEKLGVRFHFIASFSSSCSLNNDFNCEDFNLISFFLFLSPYFLSETFLVGENVLTDVPKVYSNFFLIKAISNYHCLSLIIVLI